MEKLKTWIPLLVIFLLPVTIFGQQTELIWNPALSYSWQTSDRWSYSAKISAFNSLRDLDNKTAIRYIEPKFTFTYALSGSSNIGGGYYYRWSAPLMDGYAYEHRILQQIGFKTQIGGRNFSNRFRAEQRIRSSTYQNRIRYRLSHKFPLQSKSKNTPRFISISDEIMTAFNKDAADAENRLALGMGWLFGRRQFETGFQYRTQDIFSNNGISHMLLFYTNYSIID